MIFAFLILAICKLVSALCLLTILTKPVMDMDTNMAFRIRFEDHVTKLSLIPMALKFTALR